MENVEFDYGKRSEMYDKAIYKIAPDAREHDKVRAIELLDPQSDECIIGGGEGNGYFVRTIAEKIGTKGRYLVTDPSGNQLKNLERRHSDLLQVQTMHVGLEDLCVPEGSFDKCWSFGAFHHVSNQTSAMKNIYRSVRKGGRIVICDVFQGSNLAKHFDSRVARYCDTGHEVKFLSEEFARSLCYLAGFDEDNVAIEPLLQKWRFKSEWEMGEFIYNLHALTNFQGNEHEAIGATIEGCKEHLGLNYSNGAYELNWPLKALIVTK